MQDPLPLFIDHLEKLVPNLNTYTYSLVFESPNEQHVVDIQAQNHVQTMSCFDLALPPMTNSLEIKIDLIKVVANEESGAIVEISDISPFLQIDTLKQFVVEKRESKVPARGI